MQELSAGLLLVVTLLATACGSGPQTATRVSSPTALLEKDASPGDKATADLEQYARLLEEGKPGREFLLLLTADDIKTYGKRSNLPAPLDASAILDDGQGTFTVENIVDVLFMHSNRVQLSLFIKGQPGITWAVPAAGEGKTAEKPAWKPEDGLRAVITVSVSLSEDGSAILARPRCTEVKLFRAPDHSLALSVLQRLDRYVSQRVLEIPLSLGEGYMKPATLVVTPNNLLVRFGQP